MKIKLLCDNVLIGDKNYKKGDILDYEVDGARKDAMIRDGLAEVTDGEAAKVAVHAAIPVKVEDKATLFVPAEAGAIADQGPDSLKVVAQTPLNSDGTPPKGKKS